jgi:hypothetical protein
LPYRCCTPYKKDKKGGNGMSGAEIVIGVIIGVLFEVTSNSEGTPSEQGSDSTHGKVKNPFRTIELAIAAGRAK